MSSDEELLSHEEALKHSQYIHHFECGTTFTVCIHQTLSSRTLVMCAVYVSYLSTKMIKIICNYESPGTILMSS